MHPYQPWITAVLITVFLAALSVIIAAIWHAADKASSYFDRKRRQQADDHAKAQDVRDRRQRMQTITNHLQQAQDELKNHIPPQRSS